MSVKTIRILVAVMLGFFSALVFGQKFDQAEGLGFVPPRVPYTASGDYTGANYLCRLEFGGFLNPHFNIAKARCVNPDNENVEGTTITTGCPSMGTFGDGSRVPLIGPSGYVPSETLWMQFISYENPSIGDLGRFTVMLGTHEQVTTNLGVLVVLVKHQAYTLRPTYVGCREGS